MEGIFAEAAVKKQYKTAQLQFQMEEDINLPEMKPDLDVPIAWKWNIITKDVKAGNGKVCVEGEVEYLILYSREDSVGRLEVLSGTFPFNQCLIMETVSGEQPQTKVSVVSEQVKKRNNRKLSVLLTMEMEARDEGSYTCRFMEDLTEEVEKRPGKLEMMTLCHMGKESVEIKEVLSLPSNRPDVGRVLMDQMQLRGVEVYLEDGKFIIRGEVFVFVLYESGEENPRMQFLEMTIPFEREAECGFCRDEMMLEYSYHLSNSRLLVQTNEDGEERDFSISVEMEMCYELKEKREYDYLQDTYSLTEEIRPLWANMDFEKARLCNSRRIRVSDVFSPPLSEKMLQIYPIKGEVSFAEAEAMEGGILVEGVLHADVMYITANPSDPPAVAKLHLPFHQRFEEREMGTDMRVHLRGDVSQLSVNIVDSGQAEIKATINLTVCAYEKQTIPVITGIEHLPMEKKEERTPGLTGYIAQKEDTLWSLAKENKTTIGEICKINNLTGEEISLGDKLIIESFGQGR